jgi:hypothetical protein
VSSSNHTYGISHVKAKGDRKDQTNNNYPKCMCVKIRKNTDITVSKLRRVFDSIQAC